MAHSSIQFRVRYAETDAQGIAHHSNYLIWFEQGRSELMRQAGFPYAEVEKRGFLFVVAKVEVKYKKPVSYDDIVRVETRLTRGRGRLVEFGYQVFNDRDELLVSGQTTHMVLGADRKPTTMPEDLLVLLQ